MKRQDMPVNLQKSGRFAVISKEKLAVISWQLAVKN